MKDKQKKMKRDATACILKSDFINKGSTALSVTGLLQNNKSKNPYPSQWTLKLALNIQSLWPDILDLGKLLQYLIISSTRDALLILSKPHLPDCNMTKYRVSPDVIHMSYEALHYLDKSTGMPEHHTNKDFNDIAFEYRL